MPLITILIVVAAGAGFYYYWFHIKNNSPATPPVSTSQTPPASAPATPPVAPESQNKNLRSLVVDTSQGPTEIKNAVQKFATEFASSASESDLVEVKIIGKDNQPIAKKDFFSGIGATVPDSVLMKLSEDYSLFARKEGDSVKLGVVFKTVTSSGLTDEMKNWEPTIIADLDFHFILAKSVSRHRNIQIQPIQERRYPIFQFFKPDRHFSRLFRISNFLVIGTSKDTERAILDYMSEK